MFPLIQLLTIKNTENMEFKLLLKNIKTVLPEMERGWVYIPIAFFK